MQAKIAPTSPAAKHDTVKRVWQEGELVQPPRIPWGKIVGLIFVFTLLLTAIGVTGFGWYVHHWPDSWLAKVAPLTSTSTTTVIQAIKERNQVVVPTTVQSTADAHYTLDRNQGVHGLYLNSDATGLAWPLSGSGWLVTLTGAWPTDIASLVIIPAVGQPQTVKSTVADPSSPFIFLKTDALAARPVTFASNDELIPGQRVWILTNGTAIQRQLVSRSGPRWVSSDRLETTWSIDAPAEALIGSAVTDGEGHLVGLLGSENRVWPFDGVSVAVRSIVQSGSIERPVAGFRAADRSAAVVSGDANATGLLIGADEGQSAITAKTPAEKAGLKLGDLIVTIDGQPASGTAWTLVQQRRPGEMIKLIIHRQQQDVPLTLKLGSIHS